MDQFFKHMDDLFITNELAPRCHPNGLPVKTIGCLARKTNWISWPFETVNFSFIVSGQGSYELNGKNHEVVAPCVLTQLPGRLQCYGPDQPSGYWTEIFLIYAPDALNTLINRRLISETKPVWRIHDSESFFESAKRLINACQKPELMERADQLDRRAEELIFSSLIGSKSGDIAAEEPHYLAIQSAKDALNANLAAEVDWQSIAEGAGMSLSTFRRHWLEQVGDTPARFLTRLRMEEAARQLVTTGRPIKEIAQRVGYPDALHFSRVFRNCYKASPRDYRNSQKMR